MKPKHHAGYTGLHADLCERTLVTLLRGLGPWKQSIFLAGGLVPRYLIPVHTSPSEIPPHVGTTDVDLVLDLEVLAEVEAYRKLEKNLRDLGFERGTNDDGNTQHFSWRKPTTQGTAVVVDLLSEGATSDGGKAARIAGERRLSTLRVPGAHLIVADYIETTLTAELLDGRGIATETIRVANIVPFIVLKSLAYDDRIEPKDAYDIVYCLEHYGSGPEAVAAQFVDRMRRWPEESLLERALAILRDRFATSDDVQGAKKDGPTSYATFLTDIGRPNLNARRRQDASAVVEFLLEQIESRR